MTATRAALDPAQRTAWERALSLWGVHMHDPHIVPGGGRSQGAPAWFGFPPDITVDPRMVARLGAADELESVFAHELGHHVLSPSTRIDSLKIRHQLARAAAATRPIGGAATEHSQIDLLANLWSDLLVNTRVALLQRRRDAADGVSARPGIVRASLALYSGSFDTRDRLWWVYLRAYELLWNLPPATLCPVDPPPRPTAPPPARATADDDLSRVPERFRAQEARLREARARAAQIEQELRALTRTNPEFDASVVAELVRTFAADPVSGALRFGLVAWPYLYEDAQRPSRGRGGCAADDGPATPGELGRVLGDPRLHGPIPESPTAAAAAGAGAGTGEGHGQSLGLAETAGLYSASDAAVVIAAWYRTKAAPWVRPYRRRMPSVPHAELPGPLELWENGDDLAEIDWAATLRTAPQIVPGVTTRRRSFLDDEPEPAETAIELDLYIDSSGSMRDPRRESPAVLAGMILALSVLRGGGRVRVTSFSAPGQVAGTDRFVRDDGEIVAALATYFGGGTSFPLDLLRDRYAAARPEGAGSRHLVVLSDDGLASMFGAGNAAYAGVAAHVRTLLTTAVLVLQDAGRRVAEEADAAGYDVLYIAGMDEAPAVCARLAESIREAGGR
jgi:hypothetical protein